MPQVVVNSIRKQSGMFSLLFMLGLLSGHKAQETTFRTNTDTTQLYIRVELNGQPKWFLFDNAAEKSVLFLNSNQNPGNYKILSKTLIFDAQKRKDTAYIISTDLMIPDLKLKQKKRIMLAVPKAPAQLQEEGVEGILGWDLIRDHNWTIDFKACKLRINQKQSPKEQENYYKLNAIRDRFDVLSVLIQHRAQTDTFTIDFGHNQVLSTGAASWAGNHHYLKIAQLQTINQKQSNDTGYISVQNTMMISNTLCVKNVPLSYNSNKKSNLLGTGFMKAFGTIVLLNSKNQILLRKIKQTTFILKEQQQKGGKVVAEIKPLQEAFKTTQNGCYMLPVSVFSEGTTCTE